LYVVGRDDLPPGVQAVQAVHAALAYAASGHYVPETLALLGVRDELDLCWLLDAAEEAGVPAVPFREPDLGDELTAVALGPEGARLCRKFHLLLDGRR
jgi:hypothetical protein